MRKLYLSGLCQAVLALAPAHVAQAYAPGSFAEIMQARDSSRVIVWDGGSDKTIYGDARLNHAFRAWHDSLHVAHGLDFSRHGESSVCEKQIADLRRMFPGMPEVWADLLRAEIVGQFDYCAEQGYFPVDQVSFVLDAVNKAL